jgi:ABC-type Fe3+-hydroxamate transport system substrate-binding protein
MLHLFMFLTSVNALSNLRIISLVPSLTELLVYLGLEDNIVGVTKFCVHPHHLKKTKKIIGGTKNVHIDAVKQLEPTLIIANKEENVKEQIEELAKFCPVLLTEINTTDDAKNEILRIAAVTNKTAQAKLLIEKINVDFNALKGKNFPILNCAYFIWRKPYMVAGGDTFINSMLQLAGFNNVIANQNRYPAITIEEVVKLNPEIVLLSSEPYPFKEKHIEELATMLPNAKAVLVNGELFSWYGSRMLHFADYIYQLRQNLVSLV